MVTYYLKMEPHLFKDALDEQFRRLKAEKDDSEKAAKEQQEQRQKQKEDKSNADSGEVVLYQWVLSPPCTPACMTSSCCMDL